jgi:hypothetical protein
MQHQDDARRLEMHRKIQAIKKELMITIHNRTRGFQMTQTEQFNFAQTLCASLSAEVMHTTYKRFKSASTNFLPDDILNNFCNAFQAIFGGLFKRDKAGNILPD